MSTWIRSGKIRNSLLSLLAIALFSGAALMMKQALVARRYADLLTQARAELASFTHGPRQTAFVNGSQVLLEVPINPSVSRGLASEPEGAQQPDLQEIPEKLRQTGPAVEIAE